MDDEGVELGSGVMELTQSELVLHLHRREAVRWPYLCLRRYGYDSNLFSFESGRRCQTGQGEYGSCCTPGEGFVPQGKYWGRKSELRGPWGSLLTWWILPREGKGDGQEHIACSKETKWTPRPVLFQLSHWDSSLGPFVGAFIA